MTPDVARSRKESEEEGEEEGPAERVIGKACGQSPGPTLLCVAGIHGNEPAGVHGLRRVFDALSEGPLPRGELLGLAGNLPALRSGQRFVDKDLNRLWTPARVARLKSQAPGPDASVEARQQHGLLQQIGSVSARARGPLYVLDLHTTSGPGAPFAVLNDTLPNRAFALAFPVTVVLGVAENLGGTLLDYVNDLGYINVGFEAGQHDDARSVDHAEAAVWIALSASGIIDSTRPEVRRAHATLLAARGELPRVVEVRYRHPVEAADRFRMQPGFRNFQTVDSGEVLAHDREGAIRSRSSGRILMPLYQQLGEDGFFLIRDFNPIWLRISGILRRLRFDSVVHFLPGVRRHPRKPETFVVDRRFAPWRTLDVLHLLGFRKQRAIGHVIVVSRRATPRTDRLPLRG